MVATRRSAGSQGATQTQAATPVPAPSTRKRRGGAQTEPPSQPTTETPEPEQAQQGPQEPTQAPAIQPEQEAQEQEPARPTRQQPVSTAQRHSQPAQSLQSYDPWADCDDSDDDLLPDTGGGMQSFMSHLASSITAAFQARTGKQPPSQDAHADTQPATETEPAQPAEKEGQQSAGQLVKGLHWKPAVELPRQKKSTREALQTTVQADKPKGLAKQLTLADEGASKSSKYKGKGKEDTAGKGWYDLPAQKIDEDTKRELRLLRLRNAYDPKRFYKSFDNTKFPKHFAFGTVVEGPQDYYSGRLEAKQRRKTTLTEQLLADSAITKARKRRYTQMQHEATKHQKVKKRKTDLPRKERSKHRLKH